MGYKIEEMRESMIKAGRISLVDIEEICELERQYARECEEISAQCVEEGYPGCGVNYELRCEAARRYYDETIDLILSTYGD